tara:strand:+ start:208 stop:366 length:159 start_codon:yes stop_codon:yes gene_type:complete
MVRPRRLELPRDLTPTATSTLRVYQFRHGRMPIGLVEELLDLAGLCAKGKIL